MRTLALQVDEAMFESLRAAAEARGQELSHYAVVALAERLKREDAARDAEANARIDAEQRTWWSSLTEAQQEAVKSEARSTVLNGSARSLTEADAAFRGKYNLPDLSHLTRDEITARAEAALDEIAPEKRAEAERQGLL